MRGKHEGKKGKKGIMIRRLAKKGWRLTDRGGILFTLITFGKTFVLPSALPFSCIEKKVERKPFNHFLLFLFLLPLFLLPVSFSQVEHPEQILINVTDVSKTEVVKGLASSEPLINDLLNNWQKWAFFGVMISFVYSIILYMG